MFFSRVLSTLSILVLSVTIQAQQKCDGPLEHYLHCGSACPETCAEQYYPQKPKICTLNCVPGCFCQDAAVLSSSGVCVDRQECCKGENENYQIDTTCPETCDGNQDACQQPILTTAGCFCKEGYIRKSHEPGSPCIKRTECSQKRGFTPYCGRHEVYLTCGSACPDTCQDVLHPNPNKICTLQCVPGCFCRKGYYRNVFGKCVRPYRC